MADKARGITAPFRGITHALENEFDGSSHAVRLIDSYVPDLNK